MNGGWRAVGGAALLSCLLACPVDDAFICSSSEDCGTDGVCEPGGGCSFPDDTCNSGRRYGSSSPVPNTCVPVGDGSTSSTDDDTTGSTSASPTTVAPTTGGSTSSSTSSDTVPLTTGAETSTSSTTDAAESSTGQFPAFDLYDDFERADSDEVGNGWFEKTPNAFSLVDGGIRRVTGGSPYQDNQVYRPSEEWLDAEAIVEFQWLDLTEGYGNPQIMLRSQLDDIEMPGSVTGYMLFVQDANGDLALTRQIGGKVSRVWSDSLEIPVDAGLNYRLRLYVSGTDSIILDGYLELQLDENRWTVVSEVHAMDEDAQRIATPGSIALGGHVEREFWTYDLVTLESYD